MRHAIVCLLSILFGHCVLAVDMAEPAGVSLDLGPFFQMYRTAEGDSHIEALGPFFETVTSADGNRAFMIRPLYSRLSSEGASNTTTEILWPLSSIRKKNNQLSWWFATAWGTTFDTEAEKPRYRFWLLPFYYQGRNMAGEMYAAVFPLAGRIDEFLGRDRIDFALFPVFSRSTVSEQETVSWLWPVYSATGGDDVERFRVFPFYGYARKGDQIEKRFVLWPFFTQASYNLPGSSGGGYVLFPLWGHLKLEDQESWLFLPPFFRVHKGEKQDMYHLPWPFIQVASGAIDKFYVWPLFGTKSIDHRERSFLLWPIFWHEKQRYHDTQSSRFTALPFLYTETVHSVEEAAREGERVALENYWKVWPLISYDRREQDMRLRLLDLWPMRNTPAIERSWADLWTLFEVQSTPEYRDVEFLWGLVQSRSEKNAYQYFSFFPFYDREKRADRVAESRWSIFKGLIGCRKKDNVKHWKLLYFLNWKTERAEP